jgi:hypothetical protein
MNGKRPYDSRRGALLMMLFVLLIVGGIVALRMMPNEELVTRRDKESGLNSDLSQVREALDLVRVASHPEWVDLKLDDTPEQIQAKIASMSQWGFLRSEDIKDPAVPPHLWGPDKPYYWKVTVNLATNTSFEIGLDEWNAAVDTTVVEDEENYLNTTKLDEYPYQNKLGNLLNKRGRATCIRR